MSNVCYRQGDQVFFHCPGCECAHAPKAFGGGWEWNGDLVKPTFSPSILCRATVPITDDEHARIMRGEPFEPKPLVCHSYVRDGLIQFLGDCTHKLAGQTVPLGSWD